MVQSMILYAVELWAPAMKTKAHLERVDTCQGGLALRICRGYCTTSMEVARIPSDLIPLDLMADERRRSAGVTNAEKKIQKMQTLYEVQRRWSDSEKDVWIHRLMRDITPFSRWKIGAK